VYRDATIVVAVATNGVIGREQQLPWRLRTDLQRFKKITMGHALIMGRKTLESIGRLLPGRETIVLTRNSSFRMPGVSVANSLEQALDMPQPSCHPFVVGGSEVFEQALPLVNRILLTRVLADVDGDTFFHACETSKLRAKGWRITQEEYISAGENDDWPTEFETWERFGKAIRQ
jgi:dihydrofolate reductase